MWKSRTINLIGQDKVDILDRSALLVYGVGGVGGTCVEALVRSGVGRVDVVDNDIIQESNINRQLIATTSVLGHSKVSVVKKRAMDINPNILMDTFETFVTDTNVSDIDFTPYDVIIDCIDNITAKIAIVVKAVNDNKHIITCCGTGNLTDISGIKVSTIDKTNYCPLARVMRKELLKRNIKNVKCVYSNIPRKHISKESQDRRKAVPSSMIFAPSVAGLALAREAIDYLLGGDF